MKNKNVFVVAAIAGLLSGPAFAGKAKTETKTEKTCTDASGNTIACEESAKAGNGCGANGCGGASKTETKTESTTTTKTKK